MFAFVFKRRFIALPQKTMKKSIVLILVLLVKTVSFAQSDSTGESKIFANLYSAFYTNISQTETNSGFYMPTALLGYKHTFSHVSGTIIFDVTRTTNNIQVADSSGNPMNVTYFEGSKYTAFLKMAEIKWNFATNWNFSFGQLLNEQYLTFQDKFWNHRYVEVTYQELNRFGMPADFGARLTYDNKVLKTSAGIFNGEGPFRYQDANSDFLISTNIEYRPTGQITLKAYGSLWQPKADTLYTQQTVSLFAGYQKHNTTIGMEYDLVKNARFTQETWQGISAFAFHDLTNKWQVFYRFDYTIKSAYENYGSYHIAGIQYKPDKSLYTSLNIRYRSTTNTWGIYCNFGLKM